MSYSVKFENNGIKFKNEWKERKRKITYAWGLKWQSLATKIITVNGIVDTGRLRGSLTFITKDKVGDSISKCSNNKPNDFLSGSSGADGDLIVGSNVEYAEKQELENPKGAFIKPSVMNYREDYKRIAKSIMNEER